MMVAAVVLAAGASTRLGEPKQNIRFGSETLLERTVRIASLTGLQPVFVVTAMNDAPTFKSPAHNSSVCILMNEEAAEGMASSIRKGIAGAIAAGADAAIILACDQPWVTEEHLRKLAKSGGETIASAYAGRKGIPAYFPAKTFGSLMKLCGDKGAREMLRDVPALTLNKGELDIDTLEDLKRARELYASDPPL